MRIADCGIWLNHSRRREQRFSAHTNFGIKGIGNSYEQKESQWLISDEEGSHAKPPRLKQLAVSTDE